MISITTQLIGLFVVLSYSESYIHCKVHEMDESNAFWTLVFDEPNYVNDQDSGKSGSSLTDIKDEAEAFKLKNELNNIINEHFYGRAIKRENPAPMLKGSKKIGLRVTKKDLDGSTIEDMTVGMGQKLADYQRILDRYLGRM